MGDSKKAPSGAEGMRLRRGDTRENSTELTRAGRSLTISLVHIKREDFQGEESWVSLQVKDDSLERKGYSYVGLLD